MIENANKKIVMLKILIGFLLLTIYTYIAYLSMKNKWTLQYRLVSFSEAKFCLSDMLDACFSRSRQFLMIIFILALIWKMQPYFRNTIIIKYKSRMHLLFVMYKEMTVIALIITVCATLIATILGGFFSTTYECNWDERNSYMSIFCGIPKIPHIVQTQNVILIFSMAIFFTLMVVGTVILLLWWYFNPIIGVFGILVIYGLEVAVKPPVVNILFSYVQLATDKIYLNGVNYGELVLYPVILCIGIMILNCVLIRKKNLLY